MRILVVDDSDIALSMLVQTLAQAGHKVDVAHDGNEAIAWVRRGVHRFIISDWDMPGMDGLTLCRKVRSMSASYIYFVLLTAHESSDDIVAGLAAGADDFIVKPFKPAELLGRVRVGERLLALETRHIAIFAMAKLAESRDQETGQHLDRVRCYAHMLAQELALTGSFPHQVNDAFIRLIYETSPLHDIGKVGIPDSILLKQGRLTPEEFAVMQTHTTIGQSTLNAALEMFPEAQFLKFARDIVACHHERYDGTGYPNGLAGDDIPLCARIIAVADVYDAMRSKRAYKEPCSHAETSQMIIEGSASQFDPRIVDAFLNIEEQFDEVAEAMADQDVEFAY